ncbi:MAG: hypothetical protein K2P81_13485 [Bacteriovoracaceae bacterium]|nr:hypothetical protein [Bacteriovoracaceae bacterium]
MEPSDPNDSPSSGISLEELPDDTPLKEGELEVKQKIEAFKAKKRWEKTQQEDPRAARLEKLSVEEKVLAMSRQYEFDRKEPRYEILILCLLPVAMKYGQVFPRIIELVETSGGDFNVAAALFLKVLETSAIIFKFAELISAGLIFMFPPLSTTRERFLLTYDGLDTPFSLRLKPGQEERRQKIRWDQIGGVKSFDGAVKGIQLTGHSKQVLGELRWDLWRKDKVAFLKLLRKHVGEKHPLRRFVEQELGHEE